MFVGYLYNGYDTKDTYLRAINIWNTNKNSIFDYNLQFINWTIQYYVYATQSNIWHIIVGTLFIYLLTKLHEDYLIVFQIYFNGTLSWQQQHQVRQKWPHLLLQLNVGFAFICEQLTYLNILIKSEQYEVILRHSKCDIFDIFLQYVSQIRQLQRQTVGVILVKDNWNTINKFP